jgi:hypothetical protein
MSQVSGLEQLQQRVLVLQGAVVLLAACCVGLAVFLWLFESRARVRAAAPESLAVKRLAVVDDKGTERTVIAAPLPDPIVQGQRVKRDGAISGIAIYDREGNERGGYATSDAVSGALLTLDSASGEVFKVVANPEQKDGSTLFLFNGKHDGVVLTTYSQPRIEIVQNRKIIYKNPSDAPDIRD